MTYDLSAMHPASIHAPCITVTLNMRHGIYAPQYPRSRQPQHTRGGSLSTTSQRWLHLQAVVIYRSPTSLNVIASFVNTSCVYMGGFLESKS